MSDVLFEDWGLIDYSESLRRQLERVESVAQSNRAQAGYLIFCTHPPVVTIGRQTQTSDFLNWKGPVVEVSRGGRATYHGPSQLVVYPIINLQYPRKGRSSQEVRGFIRDLESALVNTLKIYNLQANGRTPQKKDAESPAADETGVWIGNKKIASIGIAVKKWITFHGAAVNLDSDSTAFQGLKPCGFEPSTMTCLEDLLGKKINREEFKKNLLHELNELLIG